MTPGRITPRFSGAPAPFSLSYQLVVYFGAIRSSDDESDNMDIVQTESNDEDETATPKKRKRKNNESVPSSAQRKSDRKNKGQRTS